MAKKKKKKRQNSDNKNTRQKVRLTDRVVPCPDLSVSHSQMLCKTSTDTHHLPPERHIEDAGQQKAEEKHPPVCCDEGKQGEHHVAQSKGKIDTNSGKDFPNPWA